MCGLFVIPECRSACSIIGVVLGLLEHACANMLLGALSR